MDNTNTTPLTGADLDKLEALARAAQPESATGTTGMHVKTWRERIQDMKCDISDVVAANTNDAVIRCAMKAEIADLRAQLAHLKPWYDAVTDACVVSGELPWNENDARGSLAKLIAWREEITLDPKVSERAAQLAAKGQGEFAWAAFADNGNVIIWSRRRDEVEPVAAKYGKQVVPVVYLAAPASTQPTDAPYFANDGHEPDWAGYAAAEAELPEIKELVNRFLGWPMPDSLSARIAPNVTKPIGTHLMNADEAKAMFEHCLQGAAVAPSDAKGGYTHADITKAHTQGYELGLRQKDTSDAKDAANAGWLSFRERFADAYLSLSVAHFSSPFWNQSMEQLLVAVDAEINKRVAERGQSPATSAADAKDAWIDVKDRLPEPWDGRLFSKSVLIVDMDSRYPHVRMSELNFEEYDGKVVPTVWSGADPTHWQPAPALPAAMAAAPSSAANSDIQTREDDSSK